MTSEKTARREQEPPRRDELDRRYGKIGIPAVAAAVRYQAAANIPAESDVERGQRRVGQAA